MVCFGDGLETGEGRLLFNKGFVCIIVNNLEFLGTLVLYLYLLNSLYS